MEIQDYENELQKIRQGMSEEEIAASDLESSIADAKRRNEKIKSETDAEVKVVRENIGKLMDAYRRFNAKIEGDMKKVGESFSKLENERNARNH